jgi:hypothetical protein
MFICAAIPAAAQLPLTPQMSQAFSPILEKGTESGPLDCNIEPFKPFLDFAFFYEVGFIVRCGVKQFEGKEATIRTLLRITPKGGTATMLGQSFNLEGMPAEMKARVDLQRVHAQFEFSGVITAGTGVYEMEVVVFDKQNRVKRKTWQAKVVPHGNESQASIALKPGEVAAISFPRWNGTSDDAKGIRLTILLDAAPINPSSTKLRAWDRAFLLGSLSSLLRCFPTASVRLTAFNLDQQRAIFHDEEFDRLGLRRLAAALTELELGTVSYKTLGHQQGWSEMLADLVRSEISRERPSDAVVFVGPNNRISEKISTESIGLKERASAPFFYFEYFPIPGKEFPDVIHHLTSAQGGTVFSLHSPGDLAAAITKMQAKLAVSAIAALSPN